MFKLRLGAQKHDRDMQSQHNQNGYDETRKFTLITRIHHQCHQMPDKRNFLHESMEMIQVFRSSRQVLLK